MADSSTDGRGSKSSNLWADDGPLDKFDTLLEKIGKKPGAKAFEKTPALNWLKGDGSRSGYYVPKTTIRENDAERTTGVDFTGNGTLDADVKWDFLDDFNSFGSNGKTDGSMGVGWWGSCDSVAMAGQLFKEPLKAVTKHGVEFTPQDIKGLLVIIADAQGGSTEFVGHRNDGLPDLIQLTDGSAIRGTIKGMKIADFRTGDHRYRRGNICTLRNPGRDLSVETPDGKTIEIKAAKVQSISREDEEDVQASLFHKTVKAWLRDKRPFAMDHDRSSHVWNDSYDGADIIKTTTPPDDIDVTKLNGRRGPYSGGELTFYDTTLLKGERRAKRYRYWIEKKDGRDINSGWRVDPGYDRNPDFLWRSTRQPTFEGANPRNPAVLPKLVKELYEESTGEVV